MFYLIDSHAHINFNAYREDGDEVIKRALKQGVGMILVGSQIDTSKRAVEYAKKYENGVWAAVGLHPIHLKQRKIKEELDPQELIEFESWPEDFDEEKYKEIAAHPKVVAIGEIGLDYYRLELKSEESAFAKVPADAKSLAGKSADKQKEVFLKQLKLARELNKPVILHCRDAHQDVLEILNNPSTRSPRFAGEAGSARSGNKEALKGIIHSFSGNFQEALTYIELGFLIGFNGLITFNSQWDKVIKELPLKKMVLETDCPYLTPLPFRGKRNEPLYVKYVAQKIAEIKNTSFEEVREQTVKNTKILFNI